MTGDRRPAALLLSAVLLLSGCGFRGAYSFDLPGGADLGDSSYAVQIQFADVLDLVPQSAVRVADVPVGRVEDIELADDWTALVTVRVNGDVQLPQNSVAMISQSSLLGEKYVELAPPGDKAPTGTLDDGSLITLDRTNRNVEVEELLGALSLVLNGGGLAQLQTITAELGQALEGREDAVRDTLDQLDVFIGGLDEQRTEIARALDSVNALATTLAARTETIDTALDSIGPGLSVLESQRSLLVDMLTSLAQLGDVGTRVIDQAGADTVQDLRLLQPILSQLAAAGPDLVGSLDLLLTYPFPASSLTALVPRETVDPIDNSRGYAMFTNMTAALNLDLSELLCRYGVTSSGALVVQSAAQAATGGCGSTSAPAASGTPGGGVPALPPFTVPTLPGDLLGVVPDLAATAAGAGGLLGLPDVGTLLPAAGTP